LRRFDSSKAFGLIAQWQKRRVAPSPTPVSGARRPPSYGVRPGDDGLRRADQPAGGRQAAVDGLSFVVKPGQVTGFLGPNGAGKSTTMRMIVGLDRPPAGTARWWCRRRP
jgi:ABC-type multidrug transport system fused ATPase/permease subunit